MPRPVVGAQVPLAFTVRDATGALVDSTTQTLTITGPDGSNPAPPAINHLSTGSYVGYFIPSVAGHFSWTSATTGPTTVGQPDAFNVGTLSDAPIVGLAEVREHLSITSTASDGQLVTFAARASDLAESYMGRVWRRTVITGETHDGGRIAVQLRRGPVQTVTAVTESGATLTAGDYVLDPLTGLLSRGTTLALIPWMPGCQNISIDYVASPPAGVIPDDVIHGVLEEIRHLWDSQRGGSNLPRQQGADSDWDPRTGYTIPRRVSELWDRYRNPGLA